MTKTGFRLPPYLKAKNGSSGPNEFNNLENRKSRGIPLRDTASRKRVDEALKFLDRNLHGLRRGTAKHEHLIGRVRASRRPLSTAKAICQDHVKVDQRGPDCDPSDVQELWVKVFRRQGRLIYPEQERIFRQLDRSAIQGNLNRGDLERADKILRMFKTPSTVDRSWAKAEQLANVELSGSGRWTRMKVRLVGRASSGAGNPKSKSRDPTVFIRMHSTDLGPLIGHLQCAIRLGRVLNPTFS